MPVAIIIFLDLKYETYASNQLTKLKPLIPCTNF